MVRPKATAGVDWQTSNAWASNIRTLLLSSDTLNLNGYLNVIDYSLRSPSLFISSIRLLERYQNNFGSALASPSLQLVPQSS